METAIPSAKISLTECSIYRGKAPSVFTIPSNIYEDTLQRESNKQWTQKMIKLEQSSQDLKNKISEYASRNIELIARTKELTNITLKLNSYIRNNILNLRNKYEQL